MNSIPHLAPPPRDVPFSLVIVRLFNLGTQIFLVALGFTMLFVWGMVSHADLSALTFRGPLATAAGRVTAVHDTSSSAEHQRIFANHYEFSVAGTTLTGVSYGPSSTKGDRVDVEYRQSNPAASRIAGMRRDLFGPGVLVALIFPLATGVLVLIALKNGKASADLLRSGIITNAVLHSRSYDRRGGLKLYFNFTTRDGARATVDRLVINGKEANHPDGTIEPVLYDPDRPSNAGLLTDKSNKFSVDAEGRLEPRVAVAVAMSIIPLLFVIGNALAAWMRFR